MTETPVVTVFLRHRGEVLLLRRSEEVGSYPGRWGGVAGHVEDQEPLAAARSEIEEETGLVDEEIHLVRAGRSFEVDDDERATKWKVHPFLFDVDTRDVDLNWETDEAEWASPTVLLRRETVPALWTSYRRVAPSIVALTQDERHGSSYLSLRALEVLRNRAGLLATTEAPDVEDAQARLAETTHRLLEARPSMAALANRLHRTMQASQPEMTPADVETAAHEAIGQALDADAEAARRAAEQVAGTRVLTLSRSGTVLDALRMAEPAPEVIVATSRPGREGVEVAETLAASGLDVSLIPDAAVAPALAQRSVEAVMVGADTVRSSGAIINKVGTRGTAIAARQEDVPVYVACAVDKIAVADDVAIDGVDPQTVYDGPAEVGVWAPRFDETPPDLVTGGVITERGRRAPEAIDTLVDELAALREWS